MFIFSSKSEEIDWAKEPNVEEYRRLCDLSSTNPILAVAGLEELAKKKSTASMLQLAFGYMKGTPEKNIEKAKVWYAKASNEGHLGASMIYGRLCFDGQDYSHAKTAFELAVRSNDPAAFYFLGTTHLKGRGDQFSKEDGIALLRHSSSLGFPFASRDLALMMLLGKLGFSSWLNGIPMIFRSAWQMKNIFTATKSG